MGGVTLFSVVRVIMKLNILDIMGKSFWPHCGDSGQVKHPLLLGLQQSQCGQHRHQIHLLGLSYYL